MHPTRFLAALLFSTALVAAPAWAGPPLICHASTIGSQRSLPWLANGGWNGADPSYDVSHLQADTLNLLTPSAPIDVRMETIRRAIIYASRQSGLDDRLAAALFARVLDGEALGSANPAAWFDAGYFAETQREAARIFPNVRAGEQVEGVSWMRMAIRLGGSGMQPAVTEVERARAEWR
jgi:hypothetical protein